MSDPIDEIFNGTPDGIDEDELKEMQQQEETNAAAADNTAELLQEESLPTTTESQPKQQPQPTAKAEEPKESSGVEAYTDAFKDSLVNSYAAPALGLADFAVDTVNLIPGIDVPKVSKFDNDVSQAVREITSVVVPTVALTATGVGALGAAGKASKAKVLADPFVKWLGTTAFSAAAGATVDGISSTSEGDNLSGSLKQNFPRCLLYTSPSPRD